jgi:hypothetical protein
MSNHGLSSDDDDLPRTFRRAREAQERQRVEADPNLAAYGELDPTAPRPGTVTRFKVPFFSLMFFFIKAVIAAIPAIFLLFAIMGGISIAMKPFASWLPVNVEIRLPGDKK